MTKLVWSVDAVEDLKRIRRYISQDNPAAAARVIATIRASARRLRQWPRSAPWLDEVGVHKLSVVRYSYVLLYKLIDERVEILRVRHTSENWLPR